jgi:SAM-dependent methyltransferase
VSSPGDLRSAVLAREAEFHDALVAGVDPATRPPREPDWWEHAILSCVGPVEGLRILDYGCGDGELSLHLARGAPREIVGIDISPATIELARGRAARFLPGAPVSFTVGDAQSTGLPDHSFDLVVGKFVLHHLELDAALTELRRLLAPGGRAVFVETSGLNPLLRLGRAHIVHKDRLGAVKCGTADEHPLSRADLRVVRRHFPSAQVDYPNFWFWRLLDRNFLRWRWKSWTRRLHAWDEFVERRLPLLGPASFYLRIQLVA